ncbi:MAG: metalloregulator ArsR/SmtB family transcription factor [Fibrobacterales bacterium]
MKKVQPTLKFFKIISDETRMKMLMILSHSEFNVSELIEILNIHQSNISRNLTQLRDGGLLQDRRDGAQVYYRISDAFKSNSELAELLKQTWESIDKNGEMISKIDQVLDARRSKSQQFFDKVAGKYHKIAELGGGFEGLVRGYASLLAYESVVDIGAGEGETSLMLALNCKKVISVDLNQKMLDIISQKAEQKNIHTIETRIGDLNNLPLEDGEVQFALMSQVLHHSAHPQKAIIEMMRVIKPGGYFMILDLMSHDQEWVHDKMGDLWLGFETDRLKEWLIDSNAFIKTIETIHVKEGLPLLLAVGQKSK